MAVQRRSRTRPGATAQEQPGGPYVIAAFFCEKALQEPDGIISAIRIIDTLNLSPGPFPGDQGGPEFIPVPLALVVILKSGGYRGEADLVIRQISTHGEVVNELPQRAALEGGAHGMQGILYLNLQIKTEGLAWFEVWTNGLLLTRTPLAVAFQRAVVDPESGSA